MSRSAFHRPTERYDTRLAQLPTKCPKPGCGKKEARRIAYWRVLQYRQLNPEALAETVHCKWCGTEYVVKVRDYQEAKLVGS